MIENDSISYMNVYSQIYNCPFGELEESFKDFTKKIKALKVRSEGHIFYAVNGVVDEKNLLFEIFQPMMEKSTEKTELRYQSYYVINNMVSVVVEKNAAFGIDAAYAYLYAYAEENNKKVISPLYNEVRVWGGKTYVIVKAVAVPQNLEDENKLSSME